MAAGKGSRMKSNLPKPLHPVAGRAMVLRVVDALDRADVDTTVLVVGHGAEAVRRTVMSEIDDPAGILFARQLYQLGTGDAVRAGLDVVEKGEAFTDILVLNGDMPLIRPATVAKLADTHREKEAGMTILTVRLEKPYGYGRIMRDGGGKIVKIIEEADAAGEQKAIREVNAGAYCFRADFLREALMELRPANAQSEFYLTDTVELFAGKNLTVSSLEATDTAETTGVNDADQLAACEKMAGRYFN